MNQTIKRLLNGQEDNHMLPFLWVHGEDETTLRKMLRAVHGAHCGAVCIESRPHPDFCGPQWWADMDVILDEAQMLDMQVWILDDSHFPTGYAAGAVLRAPQALCRQNIFYNTVPLPECPQTALNLRELGLLTAPQKEFATEMERAMFNRPPARVFDDDRVLHLALVSAQGEEIDVTAQMRGETLMLKAPETGELHALVASRNSGYHRDYINMIDRESCKILLDAVYETHWQHYARYFGNTIAGFFSDEPEFGNGFLYTKGNVLGTKQDLPWSAELEQRMARALGAGWQSQLARLWQSDDSAQTARVHYAYMDELTRLVRETFSLQLGAWCRAHGVQYIGHVIEDDGQHCRTGSSLGHYFRSLAGQDMAGIDDIGGQVLPQGEDEPTVDFMRRPRSGVFYHYGLAKLAQSAAAIEPGKQGNAMCEIFGNYGWQEGVQLEKYLADHFLVRGINWFVPHAFSCKPFPDPDCPPHFYAHGHNPQYRHFGALMQYMNRVATLTSSGKHAVPVAVLYHGEAEWCDENAMPFEVPLRALYDAQIDCHVLPADVFANLANYQAQLGNPLVVNGQTYNAFVVPACKKLPQTAAAGLETLAAAGLPVLFAGARPNAVCENNAPLPERLLQCPVVDVNSLACAVRQIPLQAPVLTPPSNRLRMLHIAGETPVYMLANEGAQTYTGTLLLPGETGNCCQYDAWENVCRPLTATKTQSGVQVTITLEPRKSCFVVFGCADVAKETPRPAADAIVLSGWTRAICKSIDYPSFGQASAVSLPDSLAQEQSEFSGFVRYIAQFTLARTELLSLAIDDAAEGVEVFLNGKSYGVQIVPQYRYTLDGQQGDNTLVIEVATTLERQCYPLLEGYRKMLAPVPSAGSGIIGTVTLRRLAK